VPGASGGLSPRRAQATPISTQSPQLQELEHRRLRLGPIAAPGAGSTVTKALSFALPPEAAAGVFNPFRPAAPPGVAAERPPTPPFVAAAGAAPAPSLPEDRERGSPAYSTR